MKNKTTYILSLAVIGTIFIGLMFSMINKRLPGNFDTEQRLPEIFPDYSDIVIPQNIAPLNFNIKDAGLRQIAVFSNGKKKFTIASNTGNIKIPTRKWRKLLRVEDGTTITIDIFIKTKKGKWIKYPRISNWITTDLIDSHIVFRHINAGYILWGDMGIYQRNVENFKKTPLLLNKQTNNNCMNCHTFYQNEPDKMLVHMRGNPSGTLLFINDEVNFINTKTNYTMTSGVYPSWHPNGNIIAFSVNRINQKFHTAGYEDINVYDQASDIIIYNIEKKQVSTSPKLSTKSLENLPAWSPDGKYLYYITSNQYGTNINHNEVMYDLLRIEYDEKNDQWGNVDTLLRSSDTGKSISFPEISPDGKHLLFCMANYGYFTIHRKSSDLYLMNLETFEYHELSDVNSDFTESYHSWSSNSKWFLFVSKRIDGLYSRVYFSYIDNHGQVSKPLLLPQKNPGYYAFSTLNYNRPVFLKKKANIKKYKLSEKTFSEIIESEFDMNVDIEALSGATKIDLEKLHR